VKICTTAGTARFAASAYEPGRCVSARGGCFQHRRDFRQACIAARQWREPFGLECLDDEQDRDADRHGLGKNQPKAAHNRNFFGVMDDGG
jgi:hypothetical protein